MEANNFVQRIGQWPAQTRNYFGELQQEMRRVTWPSWKQVRATTVVVVIAVFAFAAYFWVVDNIFSRVVGQMFEFFSR